MPRVGSIDVTPRTVGSKTRLFAVRSLVLLKGLHFQFRIDTSTLRVSAKRTAEKKDVRLRPLMMDEKSISNQVSFYSPSITDEVFQPIKSIKEEGYRRGKGKVASPKLDVCLNSEDNSRHSFVELIQRNNRPTDRLFLFSPFVYLDLPMDSVMDPPTALLDADSTPFRF